MNKKLKTVLFFLVIGVQLASILGFVAIKNNKAKLLEEKGTEVKIRLDTVTLENMDYKGICVIASNYTLSNSIYNYSEKGYIVFKEGINGFYSISTVEEKPETDLYIKTRNSDAESLIEVYRAKAISELDIDDVYFEYLYNSERETENIASGICQGPETEAYATYLVYQNAIILKDIYINGIHIDDYVEGFMNGDIDISRYEHHFEWGSDIDWGEVAEDILNGEDVSV